MEIYYNGKNITESISVAEAKFRDVSDQRADSLDITFEGADQWAAWEPQADDVIELKDGEYSTGLLFLNTAIAEGGRYRVIATAQKRAAGRKATKSFENKTLDEIGAYCASESGMGFKVYGISGRLKYPYMIRQNEGAAAFLCRIAELEGCCLKAYSGKYLMLDILTAQALPAAETLQITAGQSCIFYAKNENKNNKLTIISPNYSVTATDREAKGGTDCVKSNLPMADRITASRWARGMLLKKNRKEETLTIQTEFRPKWSAMVRLDIAGDGLTTGAWIIDEVEHDFISKTSRATLLRCIGSVT